MGKQYDLLPLLQDELLLRWFVGRSGISERLGSPLLGPQVRRCYTSLGELRLEQEMRIAMLMLISESKIFLQLRGSKVNFIGDEDIYFIDVNGFKRCFANSF